ncbi:MAG: hypothetical protein KBA75_10350 [Alphaproteobacteria bacterium]|nr:hypothetical protein [Alphaproteobacteria bacterium]
MRRTMNIDPITPHADNLLSGVVAVWALMIAWLEPSKFLILSTIVLTVIKIVHSVILLRRDLINGGKSQD